MRFIFNVIAARQIRWRKMQGAGHSQSIRHQRVRSKEPHVSKRPYGNPSFRSASYGIRKANFSRGKVWWCHHDLSRPTLKLANFMAGYSLELNLQDPWLRPFAVYAKSDQTHDGVKGRASRVCPKAGVVESAGRFDSLSNDLRLGIGERRHVMPEEIDARVTGA
jgi:hypothetical protein